MLERIGLSCLLVTAVVRPTSAGDNQIRYRNIAKHQSGLAFAHVPSPDFAAVLALEQESLQTPIPFDQLLRLPQMSAGWPGVALFDYDLDGDVDIYVSNSAGAPNALFQNQLSQVGAAKFVDVASAAGVDIPAHNSAGVCFGDLDNDGDHDLVVLGRADRNILFENQGDGTFAERAGSGIQGSTLWSSSGALGDVDGDGLVDLVIANNADNRDAAWIFAVPFALNDHNQLFLNNGDHTFTDVSEASGIQNLGGLAPEFAGSAGPTWATTMVDIDLDGDLDILFADDQAALLPAFLGGVDRGLIHVFVNDGAGRFTDRPITVDLRATGTWMGIGVGDLDHDGRLDIFVTNFGDYALGSLTGQSLPPGQQSSRWFFGRGDGTFSDPGVGDLLATPFGWGTAIFDYDNDGDLDILSHGGLDAGAWVVADNPGAIHQNQRGSGSFRIDRDAIPDDPTCLDEGGQPIRGCTEHIRRNVRGLAVADLDRNGFADIVTAANLIVPPSLPLLPAPDRYGSVFDDTAFFTQIFAPTPDGFVWTGINAAPGDVAVELSSGNRNGWVAVTVRGSVGLTKRGRVNRDGIGAVISFTPKGGFPSTMPVTGGSSHLSQDGLERIFGLGRRRIGTLDVRWPGGVRNRLYRVRKGERVIFPEIPCSVDVRGWSLARYAKCVSSALRDLVTAGILRKKDRSRFYRSALRAYSDLR